MDNFVLTINTYNYALNVIGIIFSENKRKNFNTAIEIPTKSINSIMY